MKINTAIRLSSGRFKIRVTMLRLFSVGYSQVAPLKRHSTRIGSQPIMMVVAAPIAAIKSELKCLATVKPKNSTAMAAKMRTAALLLA
ncbi:hypothetical protein ACAX43_26585 [Paraburkholderia sp. IW21]|uniref:hypothetical protein n=1 Tax=Paraburkholderia sp. IW21 TaxID=3242488 RepID=UPI003520CC0B